MADGNFDNTKIQLLDLSQFENISSLLLSFDELGFDILTDKFHKFSSIGVCRNLCELRPLIDKLRLISTKRQKRSKKIVKS